MATVAAEVEIAAPLADVWDLYFEPRGWPAWVDQFAASSPPSGLPGGGRHAALALGQAGRGRGRASACSSTSRAAATGSSSPTPRPRASW